MERYVNKRRYHDSKDSQTRTSVQCTPQELAILLQAFNKIAIAFDSFESPSDVGFKSKTLNDVLFCLPKLKDPIKGFLGDISLKKASEGRKDIMWTDPEKYPSIADIDLVRISSLLFPKGCSICYWKAIQTVEAELQEELKLSKSPPCSLSE
jgi:DNA mismatch repair protein MSH3